MEAHHNGNGYDDHADPLDTPDTPDSSSSDVETGAGFLNMLLYTTMCKRCVDWGEIRHLTLAAPAAAVSSCTPSSTSSCVQPSIPLLCCTSYSLAATMALKSHCSTTMVLCKPCRQGRSRAAEGEPLGR